FEDGVAEDGDGELLRRDAGREGQGAGGRGVVGAGAGGAVGGGEAHGDRLGTGAGQGDGEDRVGGAGIALRHRDVGDREGRPALVVEDGADTLPVAGRRVGLVAQGGGEGLGGLAERVAELRERD